ncbi:hypothetical protein B0H16DRAFT_1612418 [Mycena metata]|uniref:Uncharacterized protein n=1 Tax=Mycena metata TaxID=1033252 RepID=A0AAD7MGZ2_9AGAR|nr:hypothetical protein B0H16DRAFT_1612418 [Mycena metata]
MPNRHQELSVPDPRQLLVPVEQNTSLFSATLNPTNNPDPDDWRAVSDPKKRKQIQDRLAQRVRRRRLKEAASSQDKSSSTSTSSRRRADVPAKDLLTYQSSTVVTVVNIDARHLPPRPMTVFTAAFQNGVILGLNCATTNFPAKSKPQPPDVPASLQPTEIQRTTAHPGWMDTLPFPRLRDNMMILNTMIDEEEFIRDFFIIPTFEITPGYASWDPAGWVAQKEFVDKYGFLFH